METSGLSYLENVKVEIYLAGVLIKTGYTDALGTYKTNVAAGVYTIILSKTGYNTITKTETITRPSELMVNLPTYILELPPVMCGIMSITKGWANPAIRETATATNQHTAQNVIGEIVVVSIT